MFNSSKAKAVQNSIGEIVGILPAEEPRVMVAFESAVTGWAYDLQPNFGVCYCLFNLGRDRANNIPDPSHRTSLLSPEARRHLYSYPSPSLSITAPRRRCIRIPTLASLSKFTSHCFRNGRNILPAAIEFAVINPPSARKEEHSRACTFIHLQVTYLSKVHPSRLSTSEYFGRKQSTVVIYFQH